MYQTDTEIPMHRIIIAPIACIFHYSFIVMVLTNAFPWQITAFVQSVQFTLS